MKPTQDTFERWNEEHAIRHDLDKFYNHPNPIFRYIENKRIRKLIEYAEIKDTDKVLEVGCGAGHILEKISKGILYGIDISETQIERAKKRLGKRVTLLKSAGESIPFEDKFFDKLLCSEVIEHVLEPLPLLQEMKRVLSDNGILSLSIPNERLINNTKSLLEKFHLMGLIAPKNSGWDLASKNNLDEWHLHEYSLELIKQQIKGIWDIRKIAAVPNIITPYRYVLKLVKI
jgi:ubiquinone/menaquinone biosynthesis C-methylase UbiE